jgi:non-ribosomal peptide synthetase-like protein
MVMLETQSQSDASEQTVVWPQFLHGLFEAQAKRRPDHPAVQCRGRTLTYAELDRRANQYAHFFRAQGIGPGRLVALHLEKSVELFGALIGVLKAGAGYVPIDPKFPADRIASIVEDGAIPLIMSQTSLATAPEGGADFQTLLIDRDHGKIDSMPHVAIPEGETGVQAHDLCYVIYTSGSTGRPKGVGIEHRNAVCFAHSLPSTYGITQDDRVYQGFSLAFDAAVEELWAALSLGGTLFIPAEDVSRSPQDVAAFIAENRISYFSTVPSFLAMITDPLPTVRLLILGGEALPAELVARFADGRRMLNTYGPTEATVVATLSAVRPGQPVTIGTALPRYETYVLDENMRQVEPGQEGELYIGGGAVARGYLNRPELTAEKFVTNPFGTSPRLYRTADLVRPRADGEIEFLGRIDGQIKIRGFRVELNEIEAVLMELPGIRNAAVATFDFNGFMELGAFVVMEEAGAEPDRAAIVEHLRAKVPPYMVPKFLETIEELPRMTSGKIDRKALPRPVNLLTASTSQEIVAPRNEIERLIVEAWAQALNNTSISVTDDFFLALGGHSLVAAQAVTLMRQKLGHEQVSVRDLYAHRTVEKLAIHLGKIQAASTKQEALPLPEKSPSQVAFESVSRWERATCYLLQAISLAVYYAAIGLPVAIVICTIMSILEEGILRVDLTIRTLIIAGFLLWPFYMGLSIGVKWLVIGRFRAGRVPLWSIAYWRFWVVRLFAGLSGATFFRGTPLMNLYFRAMGAKVGPNALISTLHCVAFDLISIGEGASIGPETQFLGYRVEDGMLVLGRVDVGDECFVGMHCSLGLDVAMKAGSRLDDLSLLSDGTCIAAGESHRGAPAEPAQVDVPQASNGEKVPQRPFLFGLLHLALIYVIGYVAIFSLVPSIHLVANALAAGVLWGIAATFAGVFLSILIYAVFVIGLKLFFGREKGGTFPLHSGEYLIHWTFDGLLGGLNSILMPVYATIYMPSLLRLLGAKIGKHAEVSTVLHISPDLLEVGDGSFLADACVVGGKRVHNGLLEVKPNRIGARSFVGNSALVPGGIDIGDDCLIGVQSTPPAGMLRTPDGTRWLGSPGFELPSTQAFTCFNAEETYKPTPALYRTRAIIDALRILVPMQLTAAGIVGFVGLTILARMYLPLWAVLMSVPFISMLLTWAAIMLAAGIKDAVLGPFEPIVKPLWSKFIWLNEFVNGVYESTAASALMPLLGTPFAVWGLRQMGCRIGRHVFMDTTLFSEFDLAEIGDYAAVNYGATIQTHLFEDRILKAGRLEIGNGATVSNMAIVLYDTKMGFGSYLAPLSVLMKGEMLPPMTRWHGVPTQQMPDPPRPAESAARAAEAAGHQIGVIADCAA